MKTRKFAARPLVGILAALVTGASAQAAGVCTNDAPNPYHLDAGWAKLPEGRVMGSASALGVSRDGRIWAADRCGAATCAGSPLAPVMRFDASGKVVASFGAGVFVQPHGLSIDPQGNIWLTDAQAADGKGQQVFKFSPDGKLLMTLGKAGVAGKGLDTFDQPTAVAFGKNGDIFVAEGHAPTNGNSRIVKFSKDGKLIKSWGQQGKGPTDMLGPHALATDSKGRLFVADKGNQRVLIFDQDGKLLDSWSQFGAPQGMFIDAKDMLYVSDTSSTPATLPGCMRGIRVASAKDGKVVAFIPDPTPGDAGSGAEGVAADAAGNIYGATVASKELRRYVRN